MLEQEQLQMMPMPTPFDGYVEQESKVSSTCLVSVTRNRYSVPCELAGQRVSSRLYPNRVTVVARLRASPMPQSVQTTLELVEAPLADAARYDSLRVVLEVLHAA